MLIPGMANLTKKDNGSPNIVWLFADDYGKRGQMNTSMLSGTHYMDSDIFTMDLCGLT